MIRPIAWLLIATSFLSLVGCGAKHTGAPVPRPAKVATPIYKNPNGVIGAASVAGSVTSSAFITRLGAASPAFSPRGDRLAFHVRDQGLFVARADGADPLHVAGTGPGDREPAWNDAGDALAFVRDASGKNASRLMRLTYATGKIDILIESGPFLKHPAWLPGGQALVYVAEGQPKSSLMRLDVTSGRSVLFVEDRMIAAPTVSADGRHVIYERMGSEGGLGLARLQLTGGLAEVLKIVGPNPRQPSFSPSGRSLAYLADDGLYVANADGSQPRRVSDFKGFAQPRWHPAAPMLVATATDGPRTDLQRIDLPAR